MKYEELTFLGRVGNTKGISADPSKVKAICSFPPPKNLKEVQQFLDRMVPSVHAQFFSDTTAYKCLEEKGMYFSVVTTVSTRHISPHPPSWVILTSSLLSTLMPVTQDWVQC